MYFYLVSVREKLLVHFKNAWLNMFWHGLARCCLDGFIAISSFGVRLAGLDGRWLILCICVYWCKPSCQRFLFALLAHMAMPALPRYKAMAAFRLASHSIFTFLGDSIVATINTQLNLGFSKMFSFLNVPPYFHLILNIQKLLGKFIITH